MEIIQPVYSGKSFTRQRKTAFANQREASFRENKLLWKQAHQRASRILLSSRWTDNHRFSPARFRRSDGRAKIRIL